MKTEGPTYVDRNTLPEAFPTHAHSSMFWEQLGRTVATFGLLEELLGKAIFVITGTQTYSESDIEVAWQKWPNMLERALSDTLGSLAASFGKAAKGNQIFATQDIEGLVGRIQAASEIRNILCHASWQVPDNEGKSLPFYINRKLEVVGSKMGIQDLRQIQQHVSDLACDLVDTVTQTGYQFPGGGGPGTRLWPPHE